MYTASNTYTTRPFFTEKGTSREKNIAQMWLSVDPLADDMPSYSPYAFSFNNPLSYIDPDGQKPYIYDQLEDGSWQRRKTNSPDGGDRVHTYNLLDGAQLIHNVQAKTFVTLQPGQNRVSNESFDTRLGSIGIGVTAEIVFPGRAMPSGEATGGGISFDVFADSDNNLDVFTTTKRPDISARKDQFGLNLAVQFSFTTGINGSPNPLNEDLIGPGRETGAGAGPFGISITQPEGADYQMYSFPVVGFGIDFGLTNWEVQTD